MSQEELVRSMYVPWAQGDFTTAAWAHPEIEFVIADGLDAGTWRGLAEMRQAWSDWRERALADLGLSE
jgi:hypothetical protein